MKVKDVLIFLKEFSFYYVDIVTLFLNYKLTKNEFFFNDDETFNEHEISNYLKKEKVLIYNPNVPYSMYYIDRNRINFLLRKDKLQKIFDGK